MSSKLLLVLNILVLMDCEILTKEKRQEDDFFNLSTFLRDAKSSDLVFVVDVSKDTDEYLNKLKTLTMYAISCITKLQSVNNSIALITFGNGSKVELGFNDYCLTPRCFEQTAHNIKTRNENRRIGSALRHAKRILKEKKENELISERKYKRQQSIVLITFGVGVNEKRIPISKRIMEYGINLAVVGLGKQAEQNRALLESMIKRRKRKAIKSTHKTSATNKAKYGQGLSYITKYTEYTFNLLQIAIQFTCI